MKQSEITFHDYKPRPPFLSDDMLWDIALFVTCIGAIVAIWV